MAGRETGASLASTGRRTPMVTTAPSAEAPAPGHGPTARGLGAAAAALVLLLAVCFAMSPVATTDFFWQLASGNWILDQGAVPRVDPFSYTARGQAWIDLHWAFQIALALLHRAVGIDGLVVVRSLLAGLLALLLMTGFASRRTSAHTAGAVLLAVLASQERFFLRPEMVSFLLLAVTMVILERHERGNAPRAVFLLVPLLAVWVNLHSLFVLGLATIGAYLAGRALDRLRGRWAPHPGPGSPKALVVALGLAVLACLANPYGLRAFALPWQQFTARIAPGNIYSASISEFRPPFSGDFGLTAVTAATVIALLGAAMILWRGRGLPSRHILLFLAFAWLALRARRNLPLFAIGTMPLLLCGWEGATLPIGRRWRTAGAAARGAVAALALILIIGVTSNRFYLWDRTARSFGSGVMPGLAPEAAVEAILDWQAPGRVFHALSDGGYLIWRAFPSKEVFIDGRLEVYDEALYRSYLAALNSSDAFEALARRWDVRIVLFNHAVAVSARPLLQHLAASSEWILAHVDATALVFLRDGPHRPAGPAAVDLATVRAGEMLATQRPTSRLDRFLRGLSPLRIEPPLQAVRLGTTFALLEQPDRAEEFFRSAAVGGELPPEVHYNLGIMREASGRYAEAVDHYVEAQRRSGFAADPVRWVLRRDLRRAIFERLVAARLRVRGVEDGASAAREAMNVDRAEALAVQAYQRQVAGDPEGAAAAYREVLELIPDDAEILHNLGLALLSASRAAFTSGDVDRAGSYLEEAEQVLAAAAARRPDLASAWFNLGVARLTLGRPESAVDALREAVRRQPDRAEYQHRLGAALMTTGPMAQAVEALQRAVEVNDALAPAWYDLATGLRSLERLEEARRALERCEELGLAGPEVFLERARVEALLGRPDAARAWLGRLSLTPEERTRLAAEAPELAPLLGP